MANPEVYVSLLFLYAPDEPSAQRRLKLEDVHLAHMSKVHLPEGYLQNNIAHRYGNTAVRIPTNNALFTSFDPVEHITRIISALHQDTTSTSLFPAWRMKYGDSLPPGWQDVLLVRDLIKSAHLG